MVCMLKWLELTVEMVRTTYVVTRDHGCEGRCTIFSSKLKSTKCVGCDGGGGAVAVTLGLHASVNTSRVAPPQLNISIGDRLTPRRVDHVDVEVSYCSFLASENVRPNKLASDP